MTLIFEIVGIVRNYKTRGYDNPSWQSFRKPCPYSVRFNWRVFHGQDLR